MMALCRNLAQFAAIAVAAAVGLSSPVARAQPTKIIKIVVPLAPGGPTDVMARLLAEKVSHAIGLQVIVENRPGAGGAIGTEAVARAAADGSTLLIHGNGFVVLPQLRRVDYDPLTGFEPICHLADFPNVIVVNTASHYRALGDLLDAARANPGQLTMASLGPGTGSQVSIEMLKQAANVDMTFVPYPGYTPAINALLGGHVTAAFVDYSTAAEYHNAGKLRALAVTSPTRIATLPDVPSVAEVGYTDYEAQVWYGLFAPAHTRSTTTERIASWFSEALRTPETTQRLIGLGLFPNVKCGADFAAFLHRQYEDYAAAIHKANMKVE